MRTQDFDIIVVGGGHAGVEAALAGARLGSRVALVTPDRRKIGFMSCNPSVGGLGKGHIVRELDILGGVMGQLADKTCIQFKRLNSSKGPAVRGTRMQTDKIRYAFEARLVCETTPNLKIIESTVSSLRIVEGKVAGVLLEDGAEISSLAVIITTGTFMNAVMFIGENREAGGRVGERATYGISDQLKSFGVNVQRLKTGTPPRLRSGSIDWNKTIPQYGDSQYFPFSFWSSKSLSLPQVACFLTRTSTETHDLIRNNLSRSPLFAGLIEGAGPRYCPSIEDKVVRFADRTSHQSFLEPESLASDSIYLQGISTSLPVDVQDRFLRTIPGLKDVEVLKYGYAVEYDFVEPRQIWPSLQSRAIEGLFLAGQVNGTSGYEEAACQGFVAGVNAHFKIFGLGEFILDRSEAYIGVLVDDLVSKGTNEPYRMLTSRAEHRLVLREDNVIKRLAMVSRQIGVLDEHKIDSLERRVQLEHNIISEFESCLVTPTLTTQKTLNHLGSPVLLKACKFNELLRRDEIRWFNYEDFGCKLPDRDNDAYESVEIAVKYEGYIRRQMELIHKLKQTEDRAIPEGFDYAQVMGLSNEEVEKLRKFKPRTLSQARRISGVNPSGLQAIMIHLMASSKKVSRKGLLFDQSPSV